MSVLHNPRDKPLSENHPISKLNILVPKAAIPKTHPTTKKTNIIRQSNNKLRKNLLLPILPSRLKNVRKNNMVIDI
jgi:hypothetical protein